MRFVDNNRVVGLEEWVVLNLVEQDAVGHDLDRGVVSRLVGEADFGADFVAVGHAELFGDTLRDREGGDAARLGATDQAVLAIAGIDEELGDLSGFARAGLTRDHDDLVVLDGTNDLLPPCMDGELFAVGGLEDGVDGDLYESWLLSGKKKATLQAEAARQRCQAS